MRAEEQGPQVEVVVLGPADVGLAQALWSVGLRPVRGTSGPGRWMRPPRERGHGCRPEAGR
jgi:hypothetical protein